MIIIITKSVRTYNKPNQIDVIVVFFSFGRHSQISVQRVHYVYLEMQQ